MLEHGGRLREAVARYGIPLAGWLDLSTGVNPGGWKAGAVPESAWRRLPEENDGLEEAAYAYYGTHQLLPAAGSQAIIQALPMLRGPCRVGVIHPGYSEHAQAWRRAGHQVSLIGPEAMQDAAAVSEVLVVSNPNNPTGRCFAPEQLLEWGASLSRRGGWLVVDEAFIDATPGESLAPFCPRSGLIVLRSLGKFFGLAGARVGFVAAEPDLQDRLCERLGPWSVAGPSRWVAAEALKARQWQEEMRKQLASGAARLHSLLAGHDLSPAGGCALFQWVRLSHAKEVHEKLARQGILTRLFQDPPSLRFGLPGNEAEWERLESALSGHSWV